MNGVKQSVIEMIIVPLPVIDILDEAIHISIYVAIGIEVGSTVTIDIPVDVALSVDVHVALNVNIAVDLLIHVSVWSLKISQLALKCSCGTF